MDIYFMYIKKKKMNKIIEKKVFLLYIGEKYRVYLK